MITIHTQFDLQRALHSDRIDPILRDWLMSELLGLWEHLGQDEPLADFDLTCHGPMWVTTLQDRKLTWQEITRQMNVQTPEFVERHMLPRNNIAYRIGFLVDNDFMPLLFALTECLDPATVAWLSEEANEVNIDDPYGDSTSDEPF